MGLIVKEEIKQAIETLEKYKCGCINNIVYAENAHDVIYSKGCEDAYNAALVLLKELLNNAKD